MRQEPETRGFLEGAGRLALLLYALFFALAFLVAGPRARPGFAPEQWLLLGLRDSADPAQLIGPAWLAGAMRDITALGSTSVLALLSLLALALLIADGRRRAALLFAATAIGGLVLETVVKALVDRPRPALVPHLVDVGTASFPSGHAMMSAVILIALVLLVRDLGARPALFRTALSGASILVVLVGASRVALGVHWPSDVAAGWVLGTAWVLSVRALMPLRS